MTPGYVDFEFDLPEALLASLLLILDELKAAPLSSDFVDEIPEAAQGVYQLFLGERLVYIGKTDAAAGLGRRLERHRRKIQHRIGLDPLQISFKAVRIYVFTAIDLETQLIAHYGGLSVVSWNNSGFGSNDPGRERDTTTYKENHFDYRFPINIDQPLGVRLPSTGTATSILETLKRNIPYVFRYQTASKGSRQAHPDLDTTMVATTLGDTATARRVIEEAVLQLPAGWQATQLPSHIILYKENRAYPQGKVIARS